MAVKFGDAIRAGRLLIGTPYAELDCINFIKKIIRTSFGGVKDYTTAGTNTLWKSYTASSKYKDLTWRLEGIKNARAGMLAFKKNGDDVHHVGLVTGKGTVIHSSSKNGRGVVETPLSASEGWNLLAKHRYITAAEGEEEMIQAVTESKALYSAIVNTESGALNIREWAGTGPVVGRVPKGRTVEVLAEAGDGWPKIRYGESVGYVSEQYLIAIEDAPVQEEPPEETQTETVPVTIIVDSEGNQFRPVGDFRVYFGSVD